MPNDLKPCPFCGGEASVVRSYPQTLFSDEGATCHFKVTCHTMGCLGSAINLWDYTKERARAAWNRRANDEQAD